MYILLQGRLNKFLTGLYNIALLVNKLWGEKKLTKSLTKLVLYIQEFGCYGQIHYLNQVWICYTI